MVLRHVKTVLKPWYHTQFGLLVSIVRFSGELVTVDILLIFEAQWWFAWQPSPTNCTRDFAGPRKKLRNRRLALSLQSEVGTIGPIISMLHHWMFKFRVLFKKDSKMTIPKWEPLWSWKIQSKVNRALILMILHIYHKFLHFRWFNLVFLHDFVHFLASFFQKP